MGHHWAPCSCQGWGESLIDPVSESLINHPKSAPRDEGEKTGDKGYLYDYVCINHRGERCAQHHKQRLGSSFLTKFSSERESYIRPRMSTSEDGLLRCSACSVKPPRLSRWHQWQSLLWLPVIELNKWLRFQWRLLRPLALCLARATADLINF